MKKLALIPVIIILIILIVSGSCRKRKYEMGWLPESPVNLHDFNSQYDDFNSTSPSLGILNPFCFSTNRNSNGSEFDVIYEPMNIHFDKYTGILTVKNEYANWEIYEERYEVIKTGLNKINTTGNEFGPNLINEYSSDKFNFTLLYSTDITGKSQINFSSNKTYEDFSEPMEVQFLNSDYDDMYPTFNNDKSRIYFCSNRDENSFNIYYTNVNPEIDIEVLLSDTTNFEIFMDTILSLNSDDKCPYIFGNKMVFASNREGGFGGFDLYYSVLENGAWTEPINFGEKINTEYDEYRPILIEEGVSDTQTMMVFSSNRTGGLGGFDLYFVGIDNE